MVDGGRGGQWRTVGTGKGVMQERNKNKAEGMRGE